MNNVTNDLTRFGYRELDIAGDLLKAYAKDGSEFLNDGVQVWFNTMSGNVFLSDEDFNVGVLEYKKEDNYTIPHLVQFYSCPMCGNEGTQSDGIDNGWDFEKYNGYCTKECEDKNK